MTTAAQLYRAFARQHAWRIGLVFVAGLAARGLRISIPLLIGRFAAIRFGYAGGRAGSLTSWSGAWSVENERFPILLMGLLAAWFCSRYLERYQTAYLGERLVQSIRERLFLGQLETSPAAFSQRTVGKYLLRYSGDLKQIQNLFNLGMMGFARDLLVVIPTGILFAALLPGLALPSLCCAALLLLPLAFLNRRLYRASVRRRDRRSGLLAFVSERLEGHAVIQVLNRTRVEASKFNKHSRRLAEAGMVYFRVESFIRTLIPSLVYLVPGMLFLWLDWQGKTSTGFDPESLSLAALLLIAMAPVFRRTARVTVHWELGKLSMRKLLAVINQEKAELEEKPALELDEGEFECQDLGFHFIPGRPLFQNLNFSLGIGELCWLQSPGGSGKTTFAKLMAGLVDPTEGKMMVDGKDMLAHSLKSRRKLLAVVSDAWPMLGKTVFEAISYSRKPEKRQRAQKMLDKVQAGTPVEQRLGLDDLIGEGGSRCSSMQLKLLQYARAFLTRKPFLLLDEPLRGLDAKSEAVILKALSSLKEKRGMLILSVHEPPDGLAVDNLLSFERGNEKEEKSKLFRRLG